MTDRNSQFSQTQKPCYVYILECTDHTLYTGWTDDLEKRMHAHNTGRGAKYTRSRLPVKLLYSEVHPDPSAARKREAAIKKMTRKQKLALINCAHSESSH